MMGALRSGERWQAVRLRGQSLGKEEGSCSIYLLLHNKPLPPKLNVKQWRYFAHTSAVWVVSDGDSSSLLCSASAWARNLQLGLESPKACSHVWLMLLVGWHLSWTCGQDIYTWPFCVAAWLSHSMGLGFQEQAFQEREPSESILPFLI